MSLYPPKFLNNPIEWCRQLSQSIYQMMQGKTDNYGSFTLTASATSTVVTEAPERIGQTTVILLMPTTANAAAALSSTYVSSRNILNNQFTVSHSSNAQTDRTFNYVLIG